MSGSSLSMKARVLRPFCPMFQVTMRTDSPTNGDDTLHPGEIGRGFATCSAAATSQKLAYPPEWEGDGWRLHRKQPSRAGSRSSRHSYRRPRQKQPDIE